MTKYLGKKQKNGTFAAVFLYEALTNLRIL